MAKNPLLQGEIREKIGTIASRRVRQQGHIPAVVYGHGEKPLAISLDAHSLVENVHHGNRVIDVRIGGRKDTMLLKELQYDELGKNIIHVDLIRVSTKEKIKVSVPIQIKGTPKGAEEGGIIEEHANRIDIECQVTDIPEAVIVSVKQLEIGGSIHAGDLELPAGAKLVSDPRLLILACRLVTEAPTTVEVEEETPVAPEVIGKGKAEVEEESKEQ